MRNIKHENIAFNYVNCMDFEYFVYKNIDFTYGDCLPIKFNAAKTQVFLTIYILCLRNSSNRFKYSELIRRGNIKVSLMRNALDIFVEAGILSHEDHKDYVLTDKYYLILENMSTIWDLTYDRIYTYNHFESYKRPKTWQDPNPTPSDIKHLLKRI